MGVRPAFSLPVPPARAASRTPCACATPPCRRAEPTRRQALHLLAFAAVGAAAGMALPALADAPDDAVAAFKEVTRLQDAAFDLTNLGKFADAEKYWDKLISMKDTNAAAYSNRGNCRTSQGKFAAAVEDFDEAIRLAPEEPDCYLGKGVALEGLRDFQGALKCYDVANTKSIARFGTPDSVAINNRGNALGQMGDWKGAADAFHTASVASRENVFSRANEAYALYQMGKPEAIMMLETLLRRYPTFVDVRAALVAVYWADEDKRGMAETYWGQVLEEDIRYKDGDWVKDIRRWPPILDAQLDNFRKLR